MLLKICRKRFIKTISRPSDTRSAPSGSCIVDFSILSLHSLLCAAAMHDGRWTNNLLANRTSFRWTVSLNFGSADVHSSHPHPRGQFHWRVWCAIICLLRNHALLNTHICIHLAIPRCSFHLAHKLRVACLVFRNSMNCPHWFCSLWRLDNEFSRSWYDPREPINTDAAAPTCSRDCCRCASSTQPFLRTASSCCCDSRS